MRLALTGLLFIAPAAISATNTEKEWLKANIPAQWSSDSVPAYFGAEADVNNTRWWESFDDPVLDSLIAIGRHNNYDVAMAARRIGIARQELQQARSAYYPTLGVDAGWTRSQASGRMAGRSGQSATTSYFSAAATMSWEIDVFGKVSRQVKAAKAQVHLSATEYGGAMLTLDGEIATTYIDLLVRRAQLAVAQRHAESQEHILEITETRHRTGLVSKLDVSQAKTMYFSTTAQIPLLEAGIAADYNALAVLLGTTAEKLPAEVYAQHDLPVHYHLLGVGVPAELLRRRPDIVSAERNIDIAAARLGIAKSAYLPSLSLQASIGTAAHDLRDMFSGQSMTYSIAPTLSWTIFEGFGRRAASAEAQLALENEVDNYNLTILSAIEEVRSAMARYRATLSYIERTEQVVANSEESVRISLDQYKSGLTDFYNVVEAQLNYLTYQNSLISAKGDALTALVDLYKALGGGF